MSKKYSKIGSWLDLRNKGVLAYLVRKGEARIKRVMVAETQPLMPVEGNGWKLVKA